MRVNRNANVTDFVTPFTLMKYLSKLMVFNITYGELSINMDMSLMFSFNKEGMLKQLKVSLNV